MVCNYLTDLAYLISYGENVISLLLKVKLSCFQENNKLQEKSYILLT